VSASDFERAVQEGPREALPGLIGELARLQALALARLTRPDETPRSEPDDRLLTAEEAAALSGLTVVQLKTRKLPFRRKIGHRTVRFSERGLRVWLRRAS
jgi:predicted DNA-binding transcriptional regulator AlpA